MQRSLLMLFFILIILGCAENQNRQKVEFEGLHDSKIRVLVQLPKMIQDPACESDACRETIVASARDRSVLLLRSMLMIRNQESADSQITMQVKNAIHNPHIVGIICGELSCNALVDFCIKDDLNIILQQGYDPDHHKEDKQVKKDGR